MGLRLSQGVLGSFGDSVAGILIIVSTERGEEKTDPKLEWIAGIAPWSVVEYSAGTCPATTMRASVFSS